MKLKNLIKAWCYVFVITIVAQSTCVAQKNYWSVFGSNGCTSSTYSNRMNCNLAPSATSLTGISSINDLYGLSGSSSTKNYQNSIFSNSGQVLFSVNSDGIYGSDGEGVYSFLDPIEITHINDTMVVAAEPSYAISEINIFPCTKKPDNTAYYCVFWAHDNYGPSVPNSFDLMTADIRIVKVNVDPASGAVTILQDDVLYNNADIFSNASWRGYMYNGIAVDASTCDGSRDVYVTEERAAGYSVLRKFTFPATGELPDPNVTSFIAYEYYQSSPKTKIITRNGQKYYTYIGFTSFTSAANWGDYLNAVSITPGSVALGTANIVPMPQQRAGLLTDFECNISGFEYISSLDGFYVSYEYYYLYGTGAAPTYSGLGFIDFAATNFYQLPGTQTYAVTDLELDKNGDLFMVNGDASSGTDGQLAYIAIGASGFQPPSASTPTTPTVIQSSCSTYVSTDNYLSSYYYSPYYLTTQIKDEDYNTWSYDMLSHTVVGNEVWSPTSNPVQAASGSSTSTISIQGNIIIPAGTSLTLDGVAVKMGPNSQVVVHCNPATSGTLSYGGKLIMQNSAELTKYSTGCDAGQLWGGVVLTSDPTLPQGPLGSTHQAIAALYSGSTISYAQTGILSGYYDGTPLTKWMPTGGGIVLMNQAKLYNNNTGIRFLRYRNFNPSDPSTEINNASMITRSVISNDIPSTTGAITGIDMTGIKYLPVKGCSFLNTSGVLSNSYGIKAVDAGCVIDKYIPYYGSASIRSQFQNYQEAIKHESFSNTNTFHIRNTVFSGNLLGVDLSGSIAPILYSDTFNVPDMATGIFPYYFGFTSAAGVLLAGSPLYTVNGNTFNGPTDDNLAVGVFAYKTGGEDNYVNNNTYNNIRIGNLANYDNKGDVFGFVSPGVLGYIHHGLQFTCNTHTGNHFDIATMGATPGIDGIRLSQGDGANPAANKFSAVQYNIWAPPYEVGELYYSYSTGAASDHEPGVPAINYGTIYVNGTSTTENCPLSVVGSPRYGGSGPRELHLSALSNVAYYMSDSDGVTHRDSLYFWAHQLQSPSGDLLVAKLFLEDSLIDSANAVYDSITYHYPVGKIDSIEYTVYGRELMDLQEYFISQMTVGTPDVTLIETLTYLASADTDLLTGTQLGHAIDAASNGLTWAHIQAENWILQLAPSALDSTVPSLGGSSVIAGGTVVKFPPLYTIADTFLYPFDVDTSGSRIGHFGSSDSPQSTPAVVNRNNKIYPNPLQNMLQVQYSLAPDGDATLQITDIAGREVLKARLQNGLSSVDVAGLSPGTYLYRVTDKNIVTMKGTLMKE